ncbi:NADP-dependent 3-hydroxy acid dehydrogenase YdfG [Labrenzia sp. EL_159]|nr:NADP-dependent 3-hydroxy acid dehydrogenase YdfG [Labrenzia sp. EL_162]MBG6193215.1 NADP-dependent 3-hydroxy acid dehydrogenase YdfG [Labrenzia sp. EL_159]MBG6209931.1 NADP-dependent 3-hydroxy acid dehydrogenase YdfG [Labrenzia sp. EL_126]
MKIILVGASGDVGKTAFEELSSRHEIITAGRSSGDITVDLASPESVEAMYLQTGPVDAVISAAGEVEFGRLSDMTADTFRYGLENKVLTQIGLVLAGLDAVNDGGSFTLTSGILDRDPVLMGAGAATANGALAGFVKAAAIDLPKNLRLNVVSPGLLEVSSDQYGAWFPGHELVSSGRVGLAYAKCVEGAITGQVVAVD